VLRIFLLLITITTLSGCNPLAPLRPDSQKILGRSWADVTPIPEPEPMQCYKSLGTSTCYREEKPNIESRLVSKYDPYTPAKPKEWWEKFYD
jgi:hypothetical protein